MQGFGGVIGQYTIKRFLQGAIKNNTLSHAYIFEGAKGIGKHTMARALASTLVCETGGDDACGRCKGCMMSGADTHPDIIRLNIPSDKQSIGVDEVRELCAEAFLKPCSAER